MKLGESQKFRQRLKILGFPGLIFSLRHVQHCGGRLTKQWAVADNMEKKNYLLCSGDCSFPARNLIRVYSYVV